jgi:hypothetical protein
MNFSLNGSWIVAVVSAPSARGEVADRGSYSTDTSVGITTRVGVRLEQVGINHDGLIRKRKEVKGKV